MGKPKKRKSDQPLCIRCQEDSIDMVEVAEYRTYIEYFCNVCSMNWVVSKDRIEPVH